MTKSSKYSDLNMLEFESVNNFYNALKTQGEKDLFIDYLEKSCVEDILSGLEDPELALFLELPEADRYNFIQFNLLADCNMDAEERAQARKEMHDSALILQKIASHKGDKTHRVVKNYIQKLSELSDADYNSIAKQFSVLMAVAKEEQQLSNNQKAFQNPFKKDL